MVIRPQKEKHKSTNSSNRFGHTIFKNVINRAGILMLVIILYYGLSLLNFGCPIKKISGFPCPGCGFTHAVFDALRFRFQTALYYHPLFFLAPAVLTLILFDEFLKPLLKKTVWAIIILLFLLVYIYRLIF